MTSSEFAKVKYLSDDSKVTVPVEFFKVIVDNLSTIDNLELGSTYKVFWSPNPDESPQDLLNAGNYIMNVEDLSELERKRRASTKDGPLKGYYNAVLLQLCDDEGESEKPIKRELSESNCLPSTIKRCRAPSLKAVEAGSCTKQASKKVAVHGEKNQVVANNQNLSALFNKCKNQSVKSTSSGCEDKEQNKKREKKSSKSVPLEAVASGSVSKQALQKVAESGVQNPNKVEEATARNLSSLFVKCRQPILNQRASVHADDEKDPSFNPCQSSNSSEEDSEEDNGRNKRSTTPSHVQGRPCCKQVLTPSWATEENEEEKNAEFWKNKYQEMLHEVQKSHKKKKRTKDSSKDRIHSSRLVSPPNRSFKERDELKGMLVSPDKQLRESTNIPTKPDQLNMNSNSTQGAESPFNSSDGGFEEFNRSITDYLPVENNHTDCEMSAEKSQPSQPIFIRKNKSSVFKPGMEGDSLFVMTTASEMWSPHALVMRSPTGLPASSSKQKVAYPAMSPDKVQLCRDKLRKRILEDNPNASTAELCLRINRVEYYLGQKIQSTRASFRRRKLSFPDPVEAQAMIGKKIKE